MKHLNRFWKVWKDDYLLTLRERTQNKLKTPMIRTSSPAKVGHIVVVKDNLPRGCWKLGRIVELIKGSDQQVRSAKVLLSSKKVIGRPLNLLYPVECSEEEQYTDDKSPKNDSRETDQNGRNQQPRQAAVRAMEQITRQLNDVDDLEFKEIFLNLQQIVEVVRAFC